MIDTNGFINDLWTQFDNLFSDLQILLADQEVPTEYLKENRVIYNMIVHPSNYTRQSVEQIDEVVTSDDPSFEKDIIRKSTLYPDGTLSITAFGNNAINNLQQIREWFNIPNRADIYLGDNWNCSIRDITEIQNRTTYLETDYEKRFGFDVILNFKDEVNDRLNTIEKVEGTINGIPYEEDI
jgi:hypothetical protein